MRWLAKLLARRRRVAARRERATAFDLQRDLVGREDAVVFDVGAHVGRVAKEYRRRLPSATIHCFEPLPEAFAALRSRWAADPRVACHAFALSDGEGRARLHVNLGAPTCSLLPTDPRAAALGWDDHLRTARALEVATATMDSFCAAHGIERVDVLKLDVQGAEAKVLAGARRMLAEQRVGLVYPEVMFAPAYVGQASLADHLGLLSAVDFSLFRLFDPMLERGRMVQADALFESRALVEAHERRVR